MPKIYRFDADTTGIDSIQSLVESGAIINLPCPTFKEFDDRARELQDTIEAGDAVIFDTLSQLLETTRGDMMLGDDARESLWEQHGKFFGDKQFLNTYRGAQNLTLRRIRNLVNRGAYGIVVCHETEGRDPMQTIGKMAVPYVNPAMVDDLIAACSDVFRMVLHPEDVYDGEGRKVLEKGDHVLYLQRTEEYTAKFHVDPDRVNPRSIPTGIKEPTMKKLCDVLHKTPRCVCLYGHPMSGKTTLAASIVDVLTPNRATVARRRGRAQTNNEVQEETETTHA